MIWKVLARWALPFIVVPLAVAGVRRFIDVLESHRGSTRTMQFLRRSADTAPSRLGRPRRRRLWLRVR
jgi:hypothetical protein